MKTPLFFITLLIVAISCKKEEAEESKEENQEPTLLEKISGEYTGDVLYYEEHWWLDHVSHCPGDKDLWEYGNLTFIDSGHVEVNVLSADSLEVINRTNSYSYGSISRHIFMDESLFYDADNYSLEFKGAENDSLIIEMTRTIEGHSENWMDGTVNCVHDIYNSVYRLKRQ